MGKWQYRPEQLKLGDQGLKIIRENGLVYLAMEERTGKVGTSMVICENSQINKVLVITKIKAMDGWNEHLANLDHLCNYEVINYHSAHKYKFKPELVILDEPHAYISGFPKPSATWKEVKKIAYGLPIIYLSATPHAQGTQLLYHQLAISKWSPWAEFNNFYKWFEEYAQRDKAGNFKTIYIGPNRTAIDYKAINTEKVLKSIEHLFITKTRQELGFEHEPEDKLHYIELNESTKIAYNTIIMDSILEFTNTFDNRDYTLVCDSPIKLRTSLHMLEGGGFKINEAYVEISNKEKIDYILKVWGDSSDVAIMYQYIVEGIKLKKYFKNATILQGQTNAEGVDLSKFKHLIIYSQNFSTAQHTQRRARQANKERAEEITVHYLLVRKAVSEQVYKTCSVNKVNFVDSVFEREEL